MNIHNAVEFGYNGQPVGFVTFGPEEHISRHLLSNKMFYELDVLRKAQEIYVPGTSIVDVGANIGNHTVFFAKILGAKVCAFEPNLPVHQLLAENVRINQLESRVRTFPFGIGEKFGQGDIAPASAANMGLAQVVRAEHGAIQIVPLDAVDIPGPVGLLKIDVEGEECAVLRGAVQLLRQYRPDIIIEAATDEAYWDVLRVLSPLGYTPRGRYAWTPTYLFSHKGQGKRFKELLRSREQR